MTQWRSTEIGPTRASSRVESACSKSNARRQAHHHTQSCARARARRHTHTNPHTHTNTHTHAHTHTHNVTPPSNPKIALPNAQIL
jgi:hypothetical protein